MKRNAQILLSLALTLAMCLGLCIPAAATVSSLDAQTAKAYYTKLTELSESSNVLYASLLDMDNDGSTDLLTVSVKSRESDTANISVWQMKNGTATRTTNADCIALKDGGLGLFTQGAQTYVYAYTFSGGDGYTYYGHSIIGANGLAKEYSHSYGHGASGGMFYEVDPEFKQIVNGKESSITESAYHQALSAYGADDEQSPKGTIYFASCQFYEWSADSGEDYYETLAQLTKKANQTTPAYVYAPLTLTFYDYIFAFERAKVAKDITVTMYRDEGPDADGWYEKEQGKLVEVQPGSQVTVYQGSKSNPVEWGDVPGGSIASDGTYFPMSHSTAEIYSGAVEKSFSVYDYYRFSSENSSVNYFVVLGSNSTTATVSGFTDVKASDYYADAVKWAVGKGITSGTTATTFSPNSTCTNAQILTFLWRAYGSPEPTISNPFSNIKPSDYYYKAALWAKEKGLVSGSTFNASGPCTRATTVTYMWKAAGSPSTSSKTSFTDVSSTASYAKAVAWAVSRGITSGTSATTFSPSQTCTRGQIMTFLYRDLT